MKPTPLDPAPSSTQLLGERSLAQASERYASLFVHHPHATYSVDRHGYYTDANQHALEMTGLSLDELRRTHFSQVMHPEDVQLMQAGFERVMQGEPRMIEARVVRIDGGVVDIRCTAIPVVVGGEVVGVHGITEDVTEAKRLVRELEEANAAKLLFLATVSHEVRTPLAAIVGAVELLMDADLEPEPDHYARMVHRSSERLMRLAGEILEFSGLEAHQTVLRREPYEVRAVVEDVADWAVPLGEGHGLAVTFQVEDSVPTAAVLGDGRRVAQVLTNIVHNAITFTEHGSVDVRVRSRATDAEESADGARTWLELEVSDTGIGIAREHLDVLTRPFTLVNPCPERAHQGIGLGLAICRALADLMGGSLQVRSTPGEGSTFTFGFPLAEPETSRS